MSMNWTYELWLSLILPLQTALQPKAGSCQVHDASTDPLLFYSLQQLAPQKMLHTDINLDMFAQ